MLLLSFALSSFAQSKNSFSTDKTKFVEELTNYLVAGTTKENRAEMETMMSEFGSLWNSRYGAAESLQAMEFYELMRAKTAGHAYVNILNYTKILVNAPKCGMGNDDMQRWIRYTSNRFNKRQTQLDKYLKGFMNVVTERTLSERGNTKWIAEGATFGFPYDTACMVSVSQCDLTLQSANDRSVIHGTRGLYNVERQWWFGKGGRVDWSRFGISEEMVYAEVHDYQMELSSANYTIEEVVFYNKYYFSQPCKCVFEDAVTTARPNEKTMFPKATSKEGQEQHGKLFGDVDFLAGFGMVGNSVNFFGSSEQPAQFIFKYRNRVAVRALSKRFILSDNSLVSDAAAMRIYLYDTVNHEVDSIYHNDLGMRFNDDKNQVLFYRRDNGVGTGPFHDTYHDYDIFLEAIYWQRDQDYMDFRRLEGTSGDSEGIVASVNYFRKSDYLKIQALDMKHPMESLNQFLKLYGDEQHRFNVNDYVAYIKYPLSQVLSLILNLQAEGYLEYDRDSQMVTVLDRFFDVLASDHNEFDFDVIKFETRVTGHQPNIRLVLRTNDMMVYGIRDYQNKADVPSVILSDFKHVVILPDNARVVLKKDRNFNFSGCVMAGMYEFFTKDCLFNYNNFSIEMNKVDSLRFYARFDGKVYPVEGLLERLSGELSIDEKDNKSSVRETPDYPKFSCPGNSYKFYRTINGGDFDVTLSRDSISDEDLEGKFYFCLDPFSVENLDNLNSEDVAFKGRLVSGGIFPDIQESLVVMDDHSLGFDHVIGDGQENSYPTYGGIGNFHQRLMLSNEGFYGIGRLDVETSAFASSRFDFYLDSVVATAETFAMHESDAEVSFPKASCGPMDLLWDVKLPQLYATTKEEPICLYDSTFFTGVTHLSDQGFGGDGELTFGLTRFNSNHFDFDSQSFVADSSDFVLYDQDGTTQAFLAENYRSHVDLAGKTVQYEYLDGNSNLDFPLNKFYCSLNQAEWNMATNNIHLHGNASEFVSLLPEHDSLSFYSTNADYDMNEYVIHAHGVESVRVADAMISPWDSNIDIQRNAEIRPLEHATITADTLLQMHVYKDAAVSIYSRNNYSALGTKDYIDVMGVATPVFYDVINPVDGVTVAHAFIDDSLSFMLSPFFGFKGEVTSKATEPFDQYDGFFRLEYDCLEDTVWFASTADVDPVDVHIPVDMERIRKERQGIFNGLSYEFGSQGGYHVNFLQPMTPETVMVTMQNGELWFDPEKKSYLVQDGKHTLELTDRCVVAMQGSSNLGFDEGLTKFACYGDYVNYPNDSLTIEVLNVFNVPVFDDQVLQDIAEIYASAEGEAVDLSKTPYVEYLRSERGMTQAKALQTEMELSPYPEIKSGDFYHNTIVIPSLKMVWNPSLRAFVSVGKIGLGSLGSHVVNRYVDGYVVFDRRMGVITYFFQNDLFMTYLSYNCADGQLQVHATYGTINTTLSEMSEKNRSLKADNAQFEYVVTPYEALTDFLSRLKRAGVRGN